MEPTENNVEDQFKAFVRKEIDDVKQKILDQCNKNKLNCKDVSVRYDVSLGEKFEETQAKKSEMTERLKQLV